MSTTKITNNMLAATFEVDADSLTGILAVTKGGTGFASFTTGDLIYSNSSTTMDKLSDVATGNVLLSGGVGTAPAYGKVGLTTHVSGVLPIANGGTGGATVEAAVAALGVLGVDSSNLATGTSGYLKLDNGFMIQWGSRPTITSNGYTTTTYPVAFTKGSVAVASGARINTNAQDNNIGVTSCSASNFTVFNAADSYPMFWIAVGV